MKRVGQIYRESFVADITKGIANNKSMFLLSYSSVSSTQIGDLRKNLQNAGASVSVAKNTLAKIALNGVEHSALAEKITGQTAFVWGPIDSVEIAKVLVDFSKEAENINVQGGLLDGVIIGAQDVIKLSELPSREVLLSMLVATIQSPLTRLAGALTAKPRELLSILKQLSEKKGES